MAWNAARAEGKPVAGIASVASFFVSRVDTLVDKQLDEKIAATADPAAQAALRALQGNAAIANAKLAYERYLEVFEGARFADAQGGGGARAALPLGQHQHQESRLSRCPLCRGS